MTTALDPQIRGDDFVYNFTLGNSWTASMFTGGMKFTLRRSIPSSSTTTDADATDQASVAAGEITFADTTHGTVRIPGSRTTAWPVGRLFWDLAGAVTIGDHHYTIDRGTIPIIGDVTRSL